jgi:4-diphosphocytidyl-2-C-methyl-D-erythritol kinase
MQLFAPAKINLSFKIVRRREDGFHEIDTMMVPISLADELTIELEKAPAGIAFSCDDPTIPAGDDNLAVRAARRFFDAIETKANVGIVLRKRIPHGAGLGGGSSDAATTLLALNETFGAPVAISRLASMAAEIGSDVPFFLLQGPARCRGRGEIVQSIAGLPKLSLVLFKPHFGVPTPWAYQHWRDSRELPGIDYSPQQLGELILENDLERPVFEKHVFLAQLKEWLRQQPEVAGALLSGSGSTVFAVMHAGVRAGGLADRAKREWDPMLWTCECDTIAPEAG